MKQYRDILAIPIFLFTTSTLAYSDNSPITKHSNTTPYKITTTVKSSKTVHKSNKKNYMQSALDDWLENEWIPTVTKDKEIQKKYMQKKVVVEKKEKKVLYVPKEQKAFTLQEYVDKFNAYMKVHPSNYSESHSKKVDELPVIGKPRR